MDFLSRHRDSIRTNDSSTLSMLTKELQEYNDNASKGGVNRRRNMILLRWDIRKLERKLNTAQA